ncbi:MAG TPA: hypothetical protein VHZ30_03090 [Verrucomicrobiae bacterium]|nr:hypothetical protein [Verrucomicrobiae bacterium]
MNTIQHNGTAHSAIATTAAAPRLIGIHVTLPPLTFWSPVSVETERLSRLISTALNRRSLLVGKLEFTFDHQVLGLATVTSLGIALSMVSAELSAVGLIAGAHLAWGGCKGRGLGTDQPLPEPMPFRRRLGAFEAWFAARKVQTPETWSTEMRQILGHLGETIAKVTMRPLQSPDAKP